MRNSFVLLGVVLAVMINHDVKAEPRGLGMFEETGRFKSANAVQAAVSLGPFVYAINSKQVSKYRRDTEQEMGVSQGEAFHLNSGLAWKDKILCAHSNYPNTPERSEVMVLDPMSMELTVWKEFGDYGGSLTWIVRRGNHWLCNFAKYGAVNAETFLVEFDNEFTEVRRWNYPSEVIEKLGTYSLSGGVWYRGRLLVTGHDAEEIYCLLIPKEGTELRFEGVIRVPFTGQGFALDVQGKGLVGISRAGREVIYLKQVGRFRR